MFFKSEKFPTYPLLLTLSFLCFYFLLYFSTRRNDEEVILRASGRGGWTDMRQGMSVVPSELRLTCIVDRWLIVRPDLTRDCDEGRLPSRSSQNTTPLNI